MSNGIKHSQTHWHQHDLCLKGSSVSRNPPPRACYQCICLSVREWNCSELVVAVIIAVCARSFRDYVGLSCLVSLPVREGEEEHEEVENDWSSSRCNLHLFWSLTLLSHENCIVLKHGLSSLAQCLTSYVTCYIHQNWMQGFTWFQAYGWLKQF